MRRALIACSLALGCCASAALPAFAESRAADRAGTILAGEEVPRAAERAAHVAGTFYPGDPQILRSTVEELLKPYASVQPAAAKPRALILPHAGYSYAGPVAARGIRELQGRHYDAVVVVGFTHQGLFPGASVDDRDAYATPLGRIPVDLTSVEFLKTQPGIRHFEAAHEAPEHSLEVMLPYLQVALGEFRLVPVLMGGVRLDEADALAGALAQLAARGDYLFVFSTDLSHYHPYDEAVAIDARTTAAMVAASAADAARLFEAGTLEACGQGPILAGLRLAERLGPWQRHLLLYKNSGDTTGDKSRVVGYAAVALYDQPATEEYPTAAPITQSRVSEEAGHALVRAARQVLASRLNRAEPAATPERGGTSSPARMVPARPPPLGLEAYPELVRAQGVFVTLRKHGQLRGCIGRIQNTDTPLAQLLPEIAMEAARNDPRFPPVTAEELGELTIEVSVLTPPAPVQHPEDIVPGRDGVVLMKDGRSGVFLPQVWQETGWGREEFLRELASQKAGLDPDAWRTATLLTFQDQVFEEEPASVGSNPH